MFAPPPHWSVRVTSPGRRDGQEQKKMVTGSSRVKGTLVAFTGGALSATCTTALFQPFDLIKTRMQTSTLMFGSAPVCLTTTVNGAATARVGGMLSTIASVIRSENFAALWTGTSASMQRCVPSIGVYFATIHVMQSAVGKTDQTVSPLQALAIGAAARTIAASSVLPISVVKTRYESGRFHYQSVPQALRTIWQTEGSKGLFSGLWATLARDSPFSALYLLFYTQSKQTAARIVGRDKVPALPCGLVAGVLASVITQPADVVKTRMQLQPQVYPSTLHTLSVVVREEGARGLFRGMLPRATRRTLMAAFTWAFYEEIVRSINLLMES